MRKRDLFLCVDKKIPEPPRIPAGKGKGRGAREERKKFVIVPENKHIGHKKKMKRTDPAVRKRCRELYGDKWFETDASTKRSRQDEALRDLSSSQTSGADEIEALRKVVASSIHGYKIVSIVCVKNAQTKPLYDALKRSMSTSDERVWLFHGTTHGAAPQIVKNGFNRSYCGRNATAFGKGVYFARDLAYSMQSLYSPPDANGEKCIFAARVLVGKTVLGNASMIEPPDKFHTTVNCTSDPSIFVVYKDFQAIPEYEIRLAALSNV